MAGRLPRFGSYVVQRGDSLWKISVKAYGSGIFWKDISRANHLPRPEFILVGLKLRIPIAEVSESKTAYNPVLDAHPSPVPHVLTTPAHTLTATPEHRLDEKTKSGPFRLPSPVLFPQFKYEFKERTLAEVVQTYGTYKLSVTGEMTLQKEGVITGGLQFTKEGIEQEYKKEADAKFSSFFSKGSVKVTGDNVEISVGIGSSVIVDGEKISTSETSIVPPNGVKYKWQPREAKGVFQGFEFAGVLGYQLEIQRNSDDPPPKAEPHHYFRWAVVGGIALVVVAGVIVIADGVKDVGTGGAGLVETPVSWAAAVATFGSGMVMIRGSQRVTQ